MPAESEGFDLIGQITPYTYSEALQLIPKLAAQLLARLHSLRLPSSAEPGHADAAPHLRLAGQEAALQELLRVQLPEQLQQYTQQQVAAAQHAKEQQMQQQRTENAGVFAADTAAIADLLGLGDAVGFGPAAAASKESDQAAAAAAAEDVLQLFDTQFQTDDDLAAAVAATTQFAPDLHEALQQQQRQQQRAEQQDQLLMHHSYADFWDAEEGAEQHVGPSAAASKEADAMWGPGAAETLTEDEPWAVFGSGSSTGCADAVEDTFALLFGDKDAGPIESSTEDASALITGAAAADPADLAAAAVAAGSSQPLAALPSHSLHEDGPDADTVQLQDQDSASRNSRDRHKPHAAAAATAEASSPAGLVAPAQGFLAGAAGGDTTLEMKFSGGAAATVDAQVAEQQTAKDSFDEFLTNLPLVQQAQLYNNSAAGGSNSHQLCAAAALPDTLKHTIQEVLDLLQELAAAHNSGSRSSPKQDIAAQQMLQKITSLWQRLCDPSTRVSDPLFAFRDGPVTQAAKQGSMLFLEDFDAPSQAVTERLNSLLEPEPSFAVSEDITLGAAGADVHLPPSFQVTVKFVLCSLSHMFPVCPGTHVAAVLCLLLYM